jgi:hypothetical protein
VGQCDEAVVVVDAVRTVGVQLAVHVDDRPEQLHRLVDQVRPEVVRHPAAVAARRAGLPRRTGPRAEPLEPRLEPPHLAQRAGLDQPPDRQEVAVPPPVLERRQHRPGRLRSRDQRLGVGQVHGQRLVDDRCQPAAHDLERQRRVRRSGRRDDDEVDLALVGPGQQLLDRPHDRRVGMARRRRGGPLRVPRDDVRQRIGRVGGHQRRVEDAAGQPVPDDGGADRLGHEATTFPTSPPSASPVRAANDATIRWQS